MGGALTVLAEAGQPVIVLTRVLDAPRGKVFQAFTDPSLVPQWWGPPAPEDHRIHDGGEGRRDLEVRPARR